MDVSILGNLLSKQFDVFKGKYGYAIQMKLEPGRFLVAEAGFLLCTVTQLNHTTAFNFVGVDTGFNHMVRTTMYKSYHHIINCSSCGQPKKYIVVGNLCETGDRFTTEEREIAEVKEGDILAICCAGAYGYSMSSVYNSRNLPAEVMIDEKGSEVIRKRMCKDDLLWGY